MTIPARFNGMGFYQETVNYPFRVRRWVEGALVEDRYENNFKQTCKSWRQGHKNPLRLLPGTSTYWRDPSAYTRGVTVLDWGSGTRKFVEGTHLIQQDGIAWWDVNYFRMNPGGAFFWNGPWVAWDNGLESEAIAIAIARMKNQEAALGEAIATSRQTYDMIAETGKTLLQACLALKKGNLPAVWSILKDKRSAIRRGSDLFLQYKYGWQPMMSDIAGLWKLFNEQRSQAFIIASKGKSMTQEIHPVNGDPGLSTVSGSGTRSCRTKLYGIVDPNFVRYNDRLGLSNPLSLGWELVPFSFVVDWFVPVGQTLDALRGPARVNFLGGFSTFRGEVDFISTYFPPPAGGSDMTNHMRGFSIDRKTYGSWPKAGFFATNPFSSSHGQSAIALLLQKLTR